MMLFNNRPMNATLILGLGLLTIVLAGYPLLQSSVVVFLTLFAVLYLIRSKGEPGHSSFYNIVNFLPGHYLLLLGLGLEAGLSWFLVAPWATLIFSSILFDKSLGHRDAGSYLWKLTSRFLYCIIWGVVFYLLYRLIQIGFFVQGIWSWVIPMLIGIVGSVYLIIGLYRLKRFQEGGFNT